jgi:RNA polymerase sigma-70 factor (ECF subfamily)
LDERKSLKALETRSDPELIRSVLSGHRDGFGLLMERHQQPIFAYLYRMLTGDRETARDLTQSVFLKAYQNLASFDLERPFRPWLYRIAHNESANHLRARSRKKEVGMEESLWKTLAAPPEGTPEAVRSDEEDRLAVLHALEMLKPKYREALMLFYFEDLSYEEIAQVLDSNMGTVGTLIRRGKEKMRKLLENP